LALSILSPRRYFRPAEPSRVPEGCAVYAVGDIHGRLDLLERMHELIEADAVKRQAARTVVVYVGDYVDRGPESRGVVDLLIQQPLRGRVPGLESVTLIGNHEAFLLKFLDDPQIAGTWLMNGGDATLRSYGVDPWQITQSDNFAQDLRQAFADALPPDHLAFYRGLRLSHEEGDYLFVHAGVRPGIALDQQKSEDLMWIRDDFLGSSEDFGRIVVHGHTPQRSPQSRSNRIGIDTGAVYGGKLTSLVLEGAERRFLQV
jgi:serine/threonine protein phosphatase 1